MSPELLNLLVGHYFDDTRVHPVYSDPMKGQFYIQPQTGCRIYKNLLDECQVWRERGSWVCTFDYVAERIAMHEAGHAAICCLEEVKIEYITIEPFEEDGQRFTGRCQWDYRIKERLIADLSVRAEKETKMFLGGAEAERRFLREHNEKEEELHEGAWSQDDNNARWRAEHLAKERGSNTEAQLDRLLGLVRASIADGPTWAGLFRIAHALVKRGAINGEEAVLLFRGA